MEYTKITPNGEERCEMLTAEEKLTYIKRYYLDNACFNGCKLEPEKTCPTRLWAEWTDEQIDTAYDIIVAKDSLPNGDGMTVEEKNDVLQEYCKSRKIGENAICVNCEIESVCNLCAGAFGEIGFESETDKAYNILVNAGLIKPPVNFVKSNPDDAVESEGDAVSGLADSGTRREFASGAVRDVAEGKGRCDLLPAVAILRLAKHFERGAIKYSDRNWEKGIPIHSFIDSAIRHTMKYLDGQHDEDHLCAAAWNLICAMWTEEKHPELNDLPWAKEAEK